MNSPDQIDDDAAEAKEERRASSMSKLASLSVNKKALVGCTVLGVVGTIAGVAIGGAAEYKQQQNAMAAINDGGGTNPSKSGKSGPFCDTLPAVVCGQTVITEPAVLTDDLFCTDRVDGNTPDIELKTLNAAIKVVGKDAVIDCKGHTVRQVAVDFGSSAVNCGRNPGNNLGPDDKRKKMKKGCELYYQVGIWLVDGASAINCRVEQFYDGFFVQNGGEVKKSEASRNRRGINIRDEDNSGSDLSSKIADVNTQDNYDGIFVFDPSKEENAVIIEDVTSKYNQRSGMLLRDSDITVKDSDFSHNDEFGITITGEVKESPTNVKFEGSVSCHYNGDYGIELRPGAGGGSPNFAEINVKGVLNTSHNDVGLDIAVNSKMDFTVADHGSFISCQNDNSGIRNNVPTTFTFVDEGTDGYTCEDNVGTPLPVCVPCPTCT